jgi:hypothetical protein
MGSIGHIGASERMVSTDRAPRRCSAVSSAHWVTRSLARDAGVFVGQSILFASSVGCMLGVVVVLLKLF